MSVISDYKARIGRGGVKTYKDELIYQINNQFEKSLLEDPSSLDLEVYKVEDQFANKEKRIIKAIVNDCGENDQKAFDEKFLLTRLEDNVTYGTYIKFDGFYWVVNFREHKSIKAYNKHVIKKCNKIIKYKYNNQVYDIPVAAKNLTQYSDGLQDIVYTSMPDNKISLSYGVCSITKNINLGQRVIISGNAYRTTFIEDYQFSDGYEGNEGLASAIVVYDVLRSDDDKVSEVADNNDEEVTLGLSITGSSKVIPGGKFKYSLNEVKFSEWKIEYLSEKNDYVTLSTNESNCNLLINSNMKLIGQKFKLVSFDDLGVIQTEKIINVAGF